MDSDPQITAMLAEIVDGKSGAVDRLLPRIYDELRAMARGQLARERAGHSLQATALAHEAYLKLLGDGRASWENRRHFFGSAAEAMRRILVDHARSARRRKRGGSRVRVELDENALVQGPASIAVIELDLALAELEERDRDMAEIVKLRYFAGLTVEQTAETVGVSGRSVNRAWAAAKAWLHRRLTEGAG